MREIEKYDEISTIQIDNPRGDYKEISFRLKIKDTYPAQYYVPDSDEDVYMTIKTNYNRKKDYVIRKSLRENTITFDSSTNYFTFQLYKEDTIDLDYDNYVGDITIIRNDDKPQTVAYINLNVCAEATNSSLEVE